MTINREKYDGVHYQVVTMNMRDGSVQGHAAGCADLKRGKAKFAEPIQANDVMDVLTKHDAWLDYNADFLAEGSGAYDIDWLPCAKHVPQGDADVVDEDAEESIDGVTMKVCGKWTRFYAADGTEVGRILNSHYVPAATLAAGLLA